MQLLDLGFNVNLSGFHAIFIPPNSLLTVGAKIIVKLLILQNLSILFTIRHFDWSQWILLGTPRISIFFKKFSEIRSVFPFEIFYCRLLWWPFWRMQSRTTLSTTSFVFRTSKKTSVNNWVWLFSIISHQDNTISVQTWIWCELECHTHLEFVGDVEEDVFELLMTCLKMTRKLQRLQS